MGKMKKKGESGAATNYISRNQALKKLQLSLADFRRLCIMKGIYPREPKNRKKVNKGSTAYKTYYYVKDVQYIAHEPVLKKFREFKIFMRKLKRAMGREEYGDAKRIEENKPVYTLDHIVKERYPTFTDALRDLDDALSMVFLFSMLPQTNQIKGEFIQRCKRLKVEFQHYIMASNSLKKVFISIKGIYYQAEIQGQKITWVVPHQFAQHLPNDVDFRIMMTFIEFYTTMVGFINFQLYHNVNLTYPPQLNINNNNTTSTAASTATKYCQEVDLDDEKLAALSLSLKATIEDTTQDIELDKFTTEASNEEEAEQAKEQEVESKFQQLFDGKKFYISREVPRDALVFIIRCFGGLVSWDETVSIGSTFTEKDDGITHQLIDRPSINNQRLDRHYVQPQWVFDCVNSKQLVPVNDYVPGGMLPPHLSPFVEEQEGDYIPPERKQMLEREKELLRTEASGEEEDDDEEEASDEKTEKETEKVTKPKKKAGNKRKRAEESKEVVEEDGDGLNAEEKKLALMMLPKKKKALYDKIMHSKKKKASHARKLEEKRTQHDKKITSKKNKN